VAIVGIAVKEKDTFDIPLRCGEVYFIKLDETAPDDVMQGHILSNTNYDEGYSYLINAQPGRYAAIGCIVRSRYVSLRIFFNKALVTRLTRTVNPGAVVVLGDITVDRTQTQIRAESQLDEVQRHYYKELVGKEVRQALEDRRFLGHQFPLPQAGGSLDHENPIDSALQRFLAVLSRNLPKAWEPWISNTAVPVL